ncbi:armadillo-like helical domain-containing protein, partial [Tanacetum coccineum]
VTGTIKYDETLVNQKVKIWWPDDEMFYEGVVASFNADTKEHQILYLDEEQETLNLKREKWEIIQEYSVYQEFNLQEKAAEVEIESTDVVSETPKKKKAKIDSGASAPQGKSKDSVKRAGGASASGKSKGAASKSAGKSKGKASKSAGKSKGEASKSAGKSKGEAKANTKSKPVNLKEGEKPKEDDVEMSEAITEKKQESPEKIVYKRGKKKTASKITENEEKSEAKETSDTKPISENVKESDDGERDDVKEAESVKEKLTVTTPKTGSKSGKKRKKT